MSTYSTIAAILQGLDQGVSGYRQRQEHEAQLAQQEADRKRQIAFQDYQFAQEEAQRLGSGGNMAGAHSAILQALKAANEFDGGHRIGPKLIGTYGQKPDPKAMGPFDPKLAKQPTVVDPTQYDPNTPDFKNNANSATLNAYLGIKTQAPKVDIQPLGNGGYLKVTTNPDGTITTEEHAGTPRPLVLSQGAVAVDPTTGQPVAQGNAKTFAPRAPKGNKGGQAKPIIKDVPVGGKMHRVAMDPYSLKVIHDYGETPHKGGASDAPPWAQPGGAPPAPAQPDPIAEWAAQKLRQKGAKKK